MQKMIIMLCIKPVVRFFILLPVFIIRTAYAAEVSESFDRPDTDFSPEAAVSIGDGWILAKGRGDATAVVRIQQGRVAFDHTGGTKAEDLVLFQEKMELQDRFSVAVDIFSDTAPSQSALYGLAFNYRKDGSFYAARIHTGASATILQFLKVSADGKGKAFANIQGPQLKTGSLYHLQIESVTPGSFKYTLTGPGLENGLQGSAVDTKAPLSGGCAGLYINQGKSAPRFDNFSVQTEQEVTATSRAPQPRAARQVSLEGIVYPSDLASVVDVTKPPYNADPTGQTDCTAALIQAVDDVLRPDYEALKQTLLTMKEKPQLMVWYSKLPFDDRQQFMQKNPLAAVGQQRPQGIFPYKATPARIIYFPNGTYSVSDTITYSYNDLINKKGLELCWRLHFRGQSRDGAIIRLTDSSPGFGPGADKPVVSFIHDGRSSNVAMQNSFEDLTVEIGAGNPGAAGINFFANNCGVVRRVAIRAADEQKAGFAGLEIKGKSSTAMLISDLLVDGFDYGIKIENTGDNDNAVVENAALSGQRIAGILLKDRNASIRRLTSSNAVPAVQIEGEATLALLDSELTGTGAASGRPAIDFKKGQLLARDITTAGYAQAVARSGQSLAAGGLVREYLSTPWRRAFEDSGLPARLPVEETPAFPWPQLSDWVSVNSFGAKGDGFADDTAAIQAAMNAGKPAVYFQPGIYLVDRTITIPPAVQRVNFMYADLVAGGHLLELTNGAAFRVEGESSRPLLLEDLFAFELFYGMRLVEHASQRTLVLSDLHTQSARMYFNSVPGGKVFIENCASAVPNDKPLPGGFIFTGQQVWARQMDPERARPMTLNQNSKLWVLGFRTEARDRTAFVTAEGGVTEVMGGHFSFHGSGEPAPQVKSSNSATTVFAAAMALSPNVDRHTYSPVEDAAGAENRKMAWDQFPVFKGSQAVIIYSGDNRNPVTVNKEQGADR